MAEFIGGRWWYKKFCWLPKVCAISNDIIWLEQAYCGKRPTSSASIWHSRFEHHKWSDEIKRKTAERFTINF